MIAGYRGLTRELQNAECLVPLKHMQQRHLEREFYAAMHTHTHSHTLPLQAKNLFDPQVWLEAASQIFFSLSIALGSLIALSSYTKPHYNTLKMTLVVCFTNSFTSIFSSIIVFSVIGFRAQVIGEEISNVSGWWL